MKDKGKDCIFINYEKCNLSFFSYTKMGDEK